MKFTKGMRLASTSEFTIDDVVEYVKSQLTGSKTPDPNENSGCEKRCGDFVGSSLPEGVTPGDMASPYDVDHVPQLGANSKWYKAVLQNGEVWSPYTNRRFLPRQFLELMSDYGENISKAVDSRYNVRSFLRILQNDVENLAFMEKNWYTAFCERGQFLTIDGIRRIVRAYLQSMRDDLTDRSKCTEGKKGKLWRKFKGYGRVPMYNKVETNGYDNFGGNSETTEYRPSDWLRKTVVDIDRLHGEVHGALHAQLADIIKRIPKLGIGLVPKFWKECFIKQGAFYTLKSLVVNGHVKVACLADQVGQAADDGMRCRASNPAEGLEMLYKLDMSEMKAYQVYAVLKESIRLSCFDYNAFLSRICK